MIPDPPSRDYHNEIKAERDMLREDLTHMEGLAEQYLADANKLTAERDAYKAQVEKLEDEYYKLIKENEADENALRTEVARLKSLYEHAVETRVYYTEERNKALAEVERLTRELDAEIARAKRWENAALKADGCRVAAIARAEAAERKLEKAVEKADD